MRTEKLSVNMLVTHQCTVEFRGLDKIVLRERTEVPRQETWETIFKKQAEEEKPWMSQMSDQRKGNNKARGEEASGRKHSFSRLKATAEPHGVLRGQQMELRAGALSFRCYVRLQSVCARVRIWDATFHIGRLYSHLWQLLFLLCSGLTKSPTET